MGRIGRHILWASLLIALVSCSTASKEMWLKSRSERKDIFSESTKGPIPSRMAAGRIQASIKIKLERPFAQVSSIAGRVTHSSSILTDRQRPGESAGKEKGMERQGTRKERDSGIFLKGI